MPERNAIGALALAAMLAFGADGKLMPVKAGQSPPDLKYFKEPQR